VIMPFIFAPLYKRKRKKKKKKEVMGMPSIILLNQLHTFLPLEGFLIERKGGKRDDYVEGGKGKRGKRCTRTVK